MTKGHVPCRVPSRHALAFPPIRSSCSLSLKRGLLGLSASVLVLWLAAACLPLQADGTNAVPVQPAAADAEDFGQYLVDHQSDLAPFFTKNAGDLFKLAVPLAMGMMGWVILFTMLVGWIVDVLLSRAYAFFFAPVFADLKRAAIYATGRLFLSFVYTCLMGLAIVFSLGLAHAGIVIALAVLLLLLVACAAQIVWILYLYRTDFTISAVFYIAIIVAHFIVGFLITGPILGSRAPSAATNFVDDAITPRLEAEAQSTKHELAGAKSALDATRAKAADFQDQIAQAQTEEEQLHKEIEEKKNSDIYILSQIIKTRSGGDLASARDQLLAFQGKFPSSSLNALARTQLAEIDTQLAVAEVEKKQEEADATRAAAQARADLLARAGKGEVTLSEMRQALIGKTRAQVSGLLGLPSETASDSWGYRQQMILNPLTNEKHGLMVYFTEGIVQSVDYDMNGGPQ